MKSIKFVALLSFITFISCDESIEKQYESVKIKIIYKENKSFFPKKLINLDFASKDTILNSKGYDCKTIHDLFDQSLQTKNDYLKFVSSDDFDLILIRKDTSLTSNSIYKEFELFLLKEKIAKKITK